MEEMKYILRVIDFETTGVPSDDDEHSVVESAYIDIFCDTKKYVKNHSTLVKPTTEMGIEALATHHITAEDATSNGIDWEDAQKALLLHEQNEKIIYVAHNADFEKKFFNPDNALWIDTYKVALKLYPDAPRHNNQVLKYYLGIPDREKHHPPHRALPDCEVTTEVLLKMSEHMSFNEMVYVSRQPPYLTKLTFGKHKGLKFEDAPKDYLRWILTQTDMDEGVIAAANRVLHPELQT